MQSSPSSYSRGAFFKAFLMVNWGHAIDVITLLFYFKEHNAFFFKQTICAQCEKDACCDWVGDEGAGHFVKMVHNGIEYGDMQVSLLFHQIKYTWPRCTQCLKITKNVSSKAEQERPEGPTERSVLNFFWETGPKKSEKNQFCHVKKWDFLRHFQTLCCSFQKHDE